MNQVAKIESMQNLQYFKLFEIRISLIIIPLVILIAILIVPLVILILIIILIIILHIIIRYVSDMWNVGDFITNSLYVATIGLRIRAYYDVNHHYH